MHKEAMVHLYNGILLSHKKEHTWVSTSEVDEPRAYKVKEVRKRKTMFINMFINMAQRVKNLPAVQETWVWPLGWEDPLVKGMATHSRIPELPGDSDGKESAQCRRPGFMSWVGKSLLRKERLPTPVFLPGRSHGQSGLAGYNPWGCRESDTRVTNTHTEPRKMDFFWKSGKIKFLILFICCWLCNF